LSPEGEFQTPEKPQYRKNLNIAKAIQDFYLKLDKIRKIFDCVLIMIELQSKIFDEIKCL
jgi:hypothetical protein